MKTLTLRKEICRCDKTCSILFDARKVVATSFATATLPKCWKLGSDFVVIRVDRVEANADIAYESVDPIIFTGSENKRKKGASACPAPNARQLVQKDTLNPMWLTPLMAR